jgi:hypothetical protein
MRRGFGFLALVVTVVIIAVVGVIAYQAGWSDGFAQHVPEAGSTAAPAAYYPYYYGPHFFGFGWIFGLLFFLFIFWLLARLVFGFGRWGRMGRMGPGYGGGWHQYRDERMKEWHDRVHSGQGGQSESQSPPPPPPTTA